MKKIVQIGDKVLAQVAKEVPVNDIPSAAIQEVIADMKEALQKEEDGAAIAAPQIGVSLRIFVVSGKILGKDPEHPEADLVCINPVITRSSRRRTPLDEGCLSVRGKYGKVERAVRVTIEAYNERGEKFSRGAGGLLAQAFQHEIDHLDGILFIEKARDIEDHVH